MPTCPTCGHHWLGFQKVQPEEELVRREDVLKLWDDRISDQDFEHAIRALPPEAGQRFHSFAEFWAWYCDEPCSDEEHDAAQEAWKAAAQPAPRQEEP